jgi:hypothetical protein
VGQQQLLVAEGLHRGEDVHWDPAGESVKREDCVKREA